MEDTHTPSSRTSSKARVAWWLTRSSIRGVSPFPLTLGKLQLAAAILKRGQYRSASQCLHSIKQEHINRGHDWPLPWNKHLADLRRSCARGLGGVRQAAALELDRAAGKEPFSHVLIVQAEAVRMATTRDRSGRPALPGSVFRGRRRLRNGHPQAGGH